MSLDDRKTLLSAILAIKRRTIDFNIRDYKI